MKHRTLYILAGVFCLCTGILFFWGLQTDANLGAAPMSASSDVRQWTVPLINFTASAGVLGIVGTLVLLVYFCPSIIALSRAHRETKAILVLNLFLGMTVLGWVAALVWSFTSQVDQPSTTNPQPD